MELKLLHLYVDAMNLYGEYANVSLLARYLTDLGHSVRVETLSLYEKKDISGYDFYYMGAGTERRQKLVLPQLLQYREALLEAKRRGAVLLFTGNAFELLGSAVTDAEGKRYDCLGFAGFESNETKRRITGDVIARIGDERVVGFMNKCGHTTGVKQPLFHVEFGFGNEEACGDEGWRDGNCFGTHLTGPLLVKNPSMLRRVAKALLGDAFADTVQYPYMQRGYEMTLSELTKRMEALK